MFVVGWADNVLEYTLATAYDVSSATYAGNAERYNVGSQEASARSIAFNNDGTKMFITGSASDIIHEYTLSTAYDVSTSTYAGASESFLISEDGSVVSVVFNNIGTKMYVLGTTNDKVYEYNLDNPSSPTVCINDAITNITFNTTGATGIGTPTNLPTGVTAAWSSNVLTISGTPSVAGTFGYSVPLTGGCGTVAATGTITVLPTKTAAFIYICYLL